MGLPSVALPCLLVAASLQLSAGAVLEFPDSRRDAKVAARRTPQWLEELERASPEETLKKLPKVCSNGEKRVQIRRVLLLYCVLHETAFVYT